MGHKVIHHHLRADSGIISILSKPRHSRINVNEQRNTSVPGLEEDYGYGTQNTGPSSCISNYVPRNVLTKGHVQSRDWWIANMRDSQMKTGQTRASQITILTRGYRKFPDINKPDYRFGWLRSISSPGSDAKTYHCIFITSKRTSKTVNTFISLPLLQWWDWPSYHPVG